MTNEIATVTQALTPVDMLIKISERVASTAMVPVAYRGKPDEVLAAMLYGRELGLAEMQSLNSINIIEGRASLSAEAMRAIILHDGHTIETVEEIPNEKVRLRGRRFMSGGKFVDYEATWTTERAVQAGLCQIKDGMVWSRSSTGARKPWEKFTTDMLRARATSEIARFLFSDLIKGLSYTPEEVESFASDLMATEGETLEPPQLSKEELDLIDQRKELREMIDGLVSDAKQAARMFCDTKGIGRVVGEMDAEQVAMLLEYVYTIEATPAVDDVEDAIIELPEQREEDAPPAPKETVKAAPPKAKDRPIIDMMNAAFGPGVEVTDVTVTKDKTPAAPAPEPVKLYENLPASVNKKIVGDRT